MNDLHSESKCEPKFAVLEQNRRSNEFRDAPAGMGQHEQKRNGRHSLPELRKQVSCFSKAYCNLPLASNEAASLLASRNGTGAKPDPVPHK